MAHQSVGNIFPVKLDAIIARSVLVWSAGGLNQEALRITTLQKPTTLTKPPVSADPQALLIGHAN